MKLITLTPILLIFSTTTALLNVLKQVNVLNMKEIAAKVNSDPTSTWKASSYDLIEIPILNNILNSVSVFALGLIFPIEIEKIDPDSPTNQFYTGPERKNSDKVGAKENYPKTYDAREIYPDCTSIRSIRDQSNCGSCWAVSAASVFSDRYCIKSNGTFNVPLSGHYTMSCDKSNNGCQGGRLDRVWKFYQSTGCITGGEYQSNEGCQDYGLKQCGKSSKNNPCSGPPALTPKCMQTKCTNKQYKYEEEKNIIRAKEFYQIGNSQTKNNEINIMKDIIENGPVQIGMAVPKNFVAYKKGIYKCNRFNKADMLGGHAVKFIGWGEEKGIPYWIAVNSWGPDWGENGTFRIHKGINTCFCEDMAFGGIPDTQTMPN